MEVENQVNTIDVCQVTPYFDSSESATELSLPLTFSDIIWLRFHPVERIFFYKLTESTPTFFNSVILPNLKHSLSHTLLQFLPLAGNLIWPPQAIKPIILYTPDDGVQLTIAESTADFHLLSGNEVHGAADSRPYIPELPVTDSKASAIALKITLFPNHGFCIGISAHHAVLDGKSSTMFIKAWAHLCKLEAESLLEENGFMHVAEMLNHLPIKKLSYKSKQSRFVNLVLKFSLFGCLSKITNCRSLEEFWSFYVTQHSEPSTRRWHFVGTLSIILLLLSSFVFNLWFLFLVPLVGYGFSWYSHFFVEGNVPATFGHPVWSFLCDCKMFGLMLTGQMDREIKRLGKRPILQGF
ncbi:hypothetical protein D5086_008562 [Populus alba]|uniref:Uncharacterized protein n=1 Tax=Populus alba TaxID=43335 RepID=A0ACC4CHC3_POPAL